MSAEDDDLERVALAFADIAADVEETDPDQPGERTEDIDVASILHMLNFDQDHRDAASSASHPHRTSEGHPEESYRQRNARLAREARAAKRQKLGAEAMVPAIVPASGAASSSGPAAPSGVSPAHPVTTLAVYVPKGVLSTISKDLLMPFWGTTPPGCSAIRYSDHGPSHIGQAGP